MIQIESALQENSTPETGTAVLIVICVLFNDLKMFLLGWCNNILPYKVQFGLLLASLSQESEWCQEVFFSDMNGSY